MVLLVVVRILVLVYLGLLVLVFFGQRKFIYHPGKGSRQAFEKVAAAAGFSAWENDAGAYIGWKKLSHGAGEHLRVLIVHGNASSAIDRVDLAGGLNSIEPADVYILEYPGYGARPGSPSQHSFFQAADEAMGLLKKDGPICLVGESLGTGVACYIAGTFPQSIQGMLLIAPYNNLSAVGQYHMPLFPVKLLLRDRFTSDTYLGSYRGPIAVLVGGQDVVVPMRLGRRLYDGYQGPKRIWESPQAGHDDLLNRPQSWWRELVAFWKENSPSAQNAPAEKNSAVSDTGVH